MTCKTGQMGIEKSMFDAIDRRIIDTLRSDGRISWKELADRVHLAPSSAAERVHRLEQLGVVRGYRADVDPSKLGQDLRAVVEVTLSAATAPEHFEHLLRSRDEVTLALYITGPADYSLVVDCAGAAGLDRFIRWLKSEAGAVRTESKLVLRHVL